MQDLIDFLTARLNEAEEVAKAKRPTYDLDGDYEEDFLNKELHERQLHESLCAWREGEGLRDGCTCTAPAWVLADVASKRQILAEHVEGSVADGTPTGTCRSCDNYAVPCPTVRLMTLPYAGHSDFRDEWRP